MFGVAYLINGRVGGGAASGAAVGALATALLCGGVGQAAATPVPAGCTAADLSQTSATVESETTTYLREHPDVNEFFTTLKLERNDQLEPVPESYMSQHPQVHADLQRIRQPLLDQQQRCGWPSTELP